MTGTTRSDLSRTEPPRTEAVDYGYRAMAERRERLVAQSSPAVRARILGKPAARDAGTLDRPKPDEVRGELRALQRQLESLASEVERLRQEWPPPAPLRTVGIADVTGRFVEEAAARGYRIEGELLTFGHLQSPRRAAAWARPRMVAMWLCSTVAREASLPKVGRHFARTYTTVVHARREIGRVLKQEPALRAAALATCVALGVEAPDALQAKSRG